jgi:hypothetical protein
VACAGAAWKTCFCVKSRKCVSSRDGKLFAAERIHSSRQLTDIYLLALASKHAGRLATFDQAIPISGVCGAMGDSLCVILICAVAKGTRFPPGGSWSCQTAVEQIILVQPEVMPQLVQVGRAHFFAEDLLVGFGQVPDVFEEENNLRWQRQ